MELVLLRVLTQTEKLKNECSEKTVSVIFYEASIAVKLISDWTVSMSLSGFGMLLQRTFMNCLQLYLVINKLPSQKSVDETRLPCPRVPYDEDMTSLHGHRALQVTCLSSHSPLLTEPVYSLSCSPVSSYLPPQAPPLAAGARSGQ